jgi:hypothetical protein
MKRAFLLSFVLLGSALTPLGVLASRATAGSPPNTYLTAWTPQDSESQGGKLIAYRWDGHGGHYTGASVPWPKPLVSEAGDSVKIFFEKVEPPVTYGMDAPGYLNLTIFSKVNRRGVPRDRGLRLDCTAEPSEMDTERLCLLTPGEHEGVPGWNLHLDWPREPDKHYYISDFGLWSFPGNEAPQDDDASWLFHLAVRD